MGIQPEAVPAQIRVLTNFDALTRWAPGLANVLPEADLFSTWPWFVTLTQHGQPQGLQLALVAARRGEASPLAATQDHALAMCIQSRSLFAVYGPTWSSLSNFYSSLYGPLGPHQSLNQATLAGMLQAMQGHGPKCSVLNLSPLDPSSEFFTRMQGALRQRGFAVRTYFCFGNWYLPTQGRSYAEYEASLPSRVLNTVRRSRKKLDNAGSWSIALAREEGPSLEAAINDWKAIYDKSWKQPEPFVAFVPELIRMAARQGWLRLAVLRLNGQAIAAQLWLVKGGRALIYKLAYDHAFSKFSAGSVLTSELMRIALDDERVVEVDYLTGDDGYKRDWMSHRRERKGLAAYRWASVQGLVSLARHDLGTLWRRWRPAPPSQPAKTNATPAANQA